MLTDSVSLRVEAIELDDFWYVHHLYPAGYTNDGQIIERYGQKWYVGTSRLQLTVSAVAYVQFGVFVIDSYFYLPTKALTLPSHRKNSH